MKKRRKKSAKFSIRVSVRIKPILNEDYSLNENQLCTPNAGILWQNDNRSVQCAGKGFRYNNVVLPQEKQERTFQKVVPGLLANFVNGYDSCLFAYGQTGSGKTHTLFGKPGCLTTQNVRAGNTEDWGLFPRTMLRIFEDIDLDHATLEVSSIEIFSGKGFDLLNNKKSVRLGTAKGRMLGNNGLGNISRDTYMKRQAFLNDKTVRMKEMKERYRMGQSTKKKLSNAVDVAKVARLIEATRTSRSTMMNHRSSRSHCLIMATLTRMIGANIAQSHFLFVDLAGSEKIKKSGVVGMGMKEATATNSSLSALGRVIIALSRKQGFVPYRDSALTTFMRKSLGGNCLTHLICNVSQEMVHAEETLCTLQFGQRTATVKNVKGVRRSNRNASREIQMLEKRIEAGERDLLRMERDGRKGGVDRSVAVATQNSFTRNSHILLDLRTKLCNNKQMLSELKSRGKVNTSKCKMIEKNIKSGENAIEIHTGLLIRMVMSGLYKQPSRAYVTKKHEVLGLKAELRKICGLNGSSSRYCTIEEYEREKLFVLKDWKIEFC